MNILLDYFFPITTIEPTPAASTAFLKQACIVVSPKDGGVTTGEITLCTTMAAVALLTDNTEAQQLFDAGMSRVYVLPMDDLGLSAALVGHESDFNTILISSDFSDADVIASNALLVEDDLTFTAVVAGYDGNDISVELLDTVTAGSELCTVVGNKVSVAIEGGVSTCTQIKAAIDANEDALALLGVEIAAGQGAEAQAAFAETSLAGGDGLTLGAYTGVTGLQSTDDSYLATQAAISNRAAFHTTSSNKAKNMFYAFGKMLSNALSWRNQQYISMPLADDVNTLGAANNLFDDKVSFVISDDEFSNRLALFAAGGKAITAPYIKKNLELDLQSAALSYVSGNQPAYTKKQAALLEDELQKVIQRYIDNELIEAGTVSVTLELDNFVASGEFNIAEPKALWRIFGEMRQTL